MPIKLKRYKDGTYTPLTKPMVRRVDFGDKPESKREKAQRQLKEGTYKKTKFDRYIIDNLIP